MKNRPVILDAITNDHVNKVGTILQAEWPMNRFYNTLVDNTPSEEDEAYDIEYFPIDSITESNRPTSGICKAIVGQAFVEREHHGSVPPARFYTVDADDEYVYWQSPRSTDATGTFPVFNATNFPEPVGADYTYDGLTCVRPTVTYITEDTENDEGEPVDGTPIVIEVNKITFTVENTFAYPTDYDVQVRYTAGGGWETVASNLAIPTDGKVELWYNGVDWTEEPDLAHTRSASAVRLVVREMSQQAFFNLIELGFCLERDLSGDVTGWSDQFNMGENDFITPLGQISSNGASVILWNGDEGTYRNNNTGSDYFGILDKGVIFRCWVFYGDKSDPVQFADEGNWVREFELFSDVWSEQDDSTTVTLVDASTIFMETRPRAVMYQNMPVEEVIWRICDIIGFTNYEISSPPAAPTAPVYPVFQEAPYTTETTTQFDNRVAAWRIEEEEYQKALKKYRAKPGIIDIFWTDGEKTAWEVFGELSRATQTAIYFDSYGTLQVKTRDAAWDATKDPSYTFLRESVPGGQPANIVSLSETTEYEANKVTVSWQPTGFSETRDNIVPFEVVWEPEGDTVLRATNLAQNLLIGDKEVHLQTKEGRTWPWKGIMNVEGEWISFDAKHYVHHDEEGNRKVTWVEDYEQQQRLDLDAGAFYRHLNNYTGALRVEQRGLWGTEEKNHRIDLDNWSKTRRTNYSENTEVEGDIKLNGADSSVTLTGKKTNNSMNNYTYLHRGNTLDEGYKYLGFRMRIDKSAHKDKAGGIFFNGDGGVGTGYFLEVMATSKMNGKTRNSRNEVMFYSMKADGSKKIFGGQAVKIKDKSKNHKKGAVEKKDVGSRLAVVADRYIDFDIWYNEGGPGAPDAIQIFANGRLLMTAKPEGTWKHSSVSEFGLFAVGHSSVTVDYVYAINSPVVELLDSESYFDRINGGYYSTQADDWTYETRDARRKVRVRRKKLRKGKKWKWVWRKYDQKYKQRVYDDFGPVAHEVRDFDVKLTSNTPVLESRLYFSNDTQAVCPEYTGDITSAQFLMVNISREAAIISGDDERTSQGNGTINHKLFVYGRPVIQKDAQTIEMEDAWSIRRRGPIEIEYASQWIQNKAEAERFAEWLTTHWSRSDSTLEVEVFGNPLVELTDVVHVKYNHIDALFYVVGLTNTFEAGLSTTLSLRKVHDA